MEMYLAGASVLLVGIIMETQCGLKIASSIIRELTKRHISHWKLAEPSISGR